MRFYFCIPVLYMISTKALNLFIKAFTWSIGACTLNQTTLTPFKPVAAADLLKRGSSFSA